MNHADIVQALEEQRFADARRECQAALDDNSDDHELLHWRGLAALGLNELDAALKDLERAAALAPWLAHYQSNLGEARRRSGQFESAAQALRQALVIQPDSRSAQINLAITLMKLDQPAEALELLKVVQPVDARLFALRADAQRACQRPAAAVELYKKALEMDPDRVHAHTNLGPLLIALGRWDEALEHCQRAVELAPDRALPLMNLGRCHAALDQIEEAMACYASAHELDPRSLILAVNIAEVWLETGDLSEAQLWLDRALTIDSEDLRALSTLARVWVQDERPEEALKLLEGLQERAPDRFEVYLVSAEASWEDGDVDQALMHYQRAAALRPQNAQVHAMTGRVLASAGRMDESRTSYETALEINPRCIPALNGLAYSQRGKLDPLWVRRLEGLLDEDQLRDGAKSSVHSALGFYYDGQKDHATAAEHIETGNRLHWQHKSKRGWDYHPEQYARQVDRLIERFDREFILSRAALGHDSDMPVFVVGMPRSGTTLTEQVLAAHPQIAGVGERHFASRSLAHLPSVMNLHKPLEVCLAQAEADHLRECGNWHLQQLSNAASDPKALRIVDKMPDNYNQLGWILSQFPNARIIYARRDPRDIAVSCWMTQFAQIQWACDQEHIARRLIDHHRIMQHWLDQMPERILVQDYETLVDDPEPNIRRLIDWVGLDWHPDCLQSHRARSVVRTASINQVRQPIYKRSVKR